MVVRVVKASGGEVVMGVTTLLDSELSQELRVFDTEAEVGRILQLRLLKRKPNIKIKSHSNLIIC